MATTHYSELKAFASATDDVENASVEFDVETLSPTFRLSIGLPGRSNALAIASRLGLRPEIIEGSRQFISSEETRVETMLAQIAHDREAAAELYTAAVEAQRRAIDLRSKLEREVDAVLHERENILRAARAEAEASVIDLRRELDRAEAEMRVQGAAQGTALAALASAWNAPRSSRPSSWKSLRSLSGRSHSLAGGAGSRDRRGRPHPGTSHRQEGIVSAIPPGRSEIEIQIGSFKMRQAQGRATRGAERRSSAARREPLWGGTRFVRSQSPAPNLEFDMRGWRVDEVLPELERYLNDAYMSNMPFVRIIHGKGPAHSGSGSRRARNQSACQLVQGADSREGGEGVTIANLAV